MGEKTYYQYEWTRRVDTHDRRVVAPDRPQRCPHRSSSTVPLLSPHPLLPPLPPSISIQSAAAHADAAATNAAAGRSVRCSDCRDLHRNLGNVTLPR